MQVANVHTILESGPQAAMVAGAISNAEGLLEDLEVGGVVCLESYSQLFLYEGPSGSLYHNGRSIKLIKGLGRGAQQPTALLVQPSNTPPRVLLSALVALNPASAACTLFQDCLEATESSELSNIAVLLCAGVAVDAGHEAAAHAGGHRCHRSAQQQSGAADAQLLQAAGVPGQ